MTATTDEVRTILRALRKTGYDADDPFGLVTAELLQTLWRGISAGMFLLMILISGISLVVGAIVIANIMFVSVVERTKEIGVRRALGARRKDIRRQFLLEAALLSSIGGVIGVILGALIALAVKQVFPAQVRPLLHLPRRRRRDGHRPSRRLDPLVARRASCRRSKRCATSRSPRHVVV